MSLSTNTEAKGVLVKVMMPRLCFLFLLLLSSLAVAEKYALLVGINDYQGDISPLRYCVADVEAFGQALVETAGFKSDNVYLMTSQMTGRQQPTHVNVIRQLSLLSERVKPEDTFIFYFSGHGITKAGQSFLLTTNSDTTTKDTLTITAVNLNQAKEILSRVQAQQLLTVIDACRNDPDSGRGEEDNLLTNDFSRGFKIKRDQVQAGTPGVSATLYACAVGERAYEWPEKQHGVFSYYLLEGLNGKAANTNGEVVVTDLADYTQRKVVQWAEDVRGKKQTPWLDQSGGAKLILVENRLAAVEAERTRLESELAEIQRQLQQAEQADSALSAVEARQREAELEEKVSQAKAAEALERQRDEAARQEREVAARQQQQQSIKQAAAREQARQEQAEIQRKKQQLEAERQKLQAQQLKSMNIGQLLQKAKELQGKIDGVGPEVRAEVNRQIKAIPQPGKSQVDPQDEFETKAMYQKRLNQARQADKEKQQRYQREVSQIRSTISDEIKSRSQGYQDALALINRDVVLDETQLVLNLGRYDAENQVFADASLSAKSSGQVQSLDWSLKLPLSQAKQFKQSVENGTVKIRADVKLEANRQQAVIGSAVIEDLVQNLSYQTPMMVMVSSRPKGAQVRVDGRQEGITPLEVWLSPGSHQFEVNFNRFNLGSAWQKSKVLEIKKGASSRIKFDFGRDKLPPIIGKDGAEMVLIPAGGSVSSFAIDKYEVTNAQYRKFMRATGHREPKYWDDSDYNQSNQPVVGVSWNDAVAYAKWAGKRLPTEKEWEWAARGGLRGKDYPWGDDESLARDYANHGGTGGKDKWDKTSAPVGSLKPNGYGLHDIAGNVWEWCNDWYDSDRDRKVLRGGSCFDSIYFLRLADRVNYNPLDRSVTYGFRCVSGSN